MQLRKETEAGGSNRWRASPGDVALGHALCWSHLAIARAAKEDDGGDHDRMRGVSPQRIEN